jgi:hypothetical protein
VPTAEELASTEELLRNHIVSQRQARSPAGLLKRPTFTCNGQTVSIPTLSLFSHYSPPLTTIAAQSLTLPPLTAGTAINRYDYLYLVLLTVQVGVSQDPDVALSFQWRSNDILQTVSRENTVRLRSAYGIWVSQGEMTTAQIKAAITGQLTVSKSAPLVYGNSRLFLTGDETLTNSITYQVKEVEALSLLRVWRLQGVAIDGYQWPSFESLEASIHLQPTYTYAGEGWNDWNARLEESVIRLMRGDPLRQSEAQRRYVFNLVNGQVGGNTTAPGVATLSPNGALMLANEQRITFTNQAITQTVYAVPVVTTDDGTGKAVATVSFASNAPAGSSFANSGHAIVASDGTTPTGTFTGGGGTGALTWTATNAGAPAVGNMLYVIPAIAYPAGSGLPVCGDIEQVYLNSTALGDVREADIAAYTEPSSGNFIVVMAKRNAAIQWIYRKFTVTASSNGVVTMPNTARGLIAWISGPGAPTGRQDKAVVTGLTSNGSYSVLCYHAPPAAEQWQFQLRSPGYAGTKDFSYLNGARIDGEVRYWAHSLGGATTFNPPSRPLPDGNVANQAITYRLPRNTDAIAVQDHVLDAEINLGGLYARATPFQAIPTISGEGGSASLRPGLTIAAIAGVTNYPQVLPATLTGLSIYKPALANNKAYQLVVACGLEKDGDRRFLVLTFNQGTPTVGNLLPVTTDSPSYAGIDVFRYW